MRVPTYFVLITLCVSYCFSKKYYNYTLLRCMPVKEEHLKYLKILNTLSEIEFWRPPSRLNKPVDFMVHLEDKPTFFAEAYQLQMNLTIMIKDVQKAFDKQLVRQYTRRKLESFDWKSYYRLKDIYEWLRDLEKKHPTEMKLYSIGTAYEDRDIVAVRIIKEGSQNRPKVIMEGGIHAREWIAPAVVTYLIYHILTDIKIADISKTYDWYFVPVLNPDGYEYSHTEDRLWRKNRREDFGVDLNRNFDYAFGTVGVKASKGASVYCGPKAFSEEESRAMGNFTESLSYNLKYYFAFHSYGQHMIIPYGDTKEHYDNFDEVNKMCLQAAVIMVKKHGTWYTIGNTYETVGYLMSGASGCWVKKRFKVPYVVTFELRDLGYDGFALPAEQILPTSEETLDAIISLLSPEMGFLSVSHNTRLAINRSEQPCNILNKNVIEMRSNLKLIVFAFCINYCWSVKYNNYALLRGIPVEEEQLDFFKKLGKDYNVKYWRPPGKLLNSVEFMVRVEDKSKFIAEANKLKIVLTTVIEDVQRAFDKQAVKPYVRSDTKSFDWSHYFGLKDIYQWLEDLETLYPNELKVQSIGKTYENRDILAVRIILGDSEESLLSESFRPKVIIEGGIHAREWISPAVVTYLIYQIVNANKSNNETLTTVSEMYDWYFVPVLNPDGYEYTHNEDRLWRKNRNSTGGIDLNRNFDYAFGTFDSDKDVNSETYYGRRAFSENESLAMANFIKSQSYNLKYYFAFHSYGQYMILPYGDSKNYYGNFDKVREKCLEAIRKIEANYGTKYRVGTSYETVGYLLSGTSTDWVKTKFKVPYVVTFELRDTGDTGFALPADQIMPTCKETMDGIVSLLLPKKAIFKMYNRASPLLRQSLHIFEKIVIAISIFSYNILFLN